MVSEDLLSMSVEDLQGQLSEKEKELTNLRFQKALQQLEGPHNIRKTRREIARIRTLLRGYELGIRTVGTK